MSAAIRRVRSAMAGRRRIVQAATGKTAARTRVSSSGSPKLQVREVAAGRGHQGGADDLRPEQLRVHRGQPHDRHAAHGVADEDHRPARDPRLEDGGEVAGQLLDRGVLRRPAPRHAVAALVVEHEAGVGPVTVRGGELGGQGAPLEGPAGHGERVTVHEDDGERRLHRPDLLDREHDPVVGLDQRGPVGRAGGRTERVVRAELRRGPLAAGRDLVGQRAGAALAAPADGDADAAPAAASPTRPPATPAGCRADGAGQAGAPGGLARHQTAPAEPTYRRANRPPTRVTSS